MRRYEEYKDSGNFLLREIPYKWSTFRFTDKIELKHGFQFREDDFTDEGLKIVKITQLSPKGYLDLSNCSFIDSKRLNIFRSIIIKNGDVLMALTGGTIGKIIKADNIDEPLLQNYRVGNFYPCSNDLDKIYMFYLLSSQNTMDQINYLINRNGQPNIGKENFKNMMFPLPSYFEQQAIANYLDAKTQAIDKKVTLLEQKIETYKQLKRTLINQTITKGLRSLSEVEMKDSGISWIGQIPKHWEVKRLKELGNIETSSINKKIEEDEDLIKLVNYTDVYSNLKREIWNNDDYMVVSANKLQISSKKLKQGDVLFTPSSETINDIGVSAVVMENLHNTLYSYHLLRLRFRKVIALNFKKYLFSNDYVQYYFSKSATGTTRKILGLNTFNNLEVPLPPISEQVEIAQYLDHKTAIIDAIISNIGKQIEMLKQLRKTLINDVVTGKIMVAEQHDYVLTN